MSSEKIEILESSSWRDGSYSEPEETEIESDVRFLLVHHTATPNVDKEEDVIPRLRNIHGFHTGEKGWPDIAYNFLIDRQGRIWEGRAGSREHALDGEGTTVRGDATGGSQGFAILCCLLGDFAAERPTREAVDSLIKLLAWLADIYALDTSPGTTTEFVSRGSSRHPQGSLVEARTISGHREMSGTTCPGDVLFDMLTTEIPDGVNALRTIGIRPDSASRVLPDGRREMANPGELPQSPETGRTETPPSTKPKLVEPSSPATRSDLPRSPVERTDEIAMSAAGSERSAMDTAVVAIGGTAGLALIGIAALIRLRTRRVRVGDLSRQ